MEIKTKVISTETIKPSSPTPKILQKHQLSLIDQFLIPPVLAPFVYFYSSSNPKIPNSQKAYILKKSLSETLSRFYPLAGRLIDNLYVNCNDSGVPFAEAVANCDLSQVITNPDPKRIKKLFLYKMDDSQDLCLAVQATYFRCGGLALGLLIPHKIVDALSFITFANSWSAVARNGDFNGEPIPKFDAAAYFPPRDIYGYEASIIIKQEDEVATRIFTFPAAKIALLQERYAAASGGDHPSRMEALSVFIWTLFLSATCLQADRTKNYRLQLLVSLRSWVKLPLSEFHFGNILSLIVAAPTAEDDEVELLKKIREAKKGVYNNYAAQLKELVVQMEIRAQVGEPVVTFLMSSLCGFPMYKADFGWGKPVWVVSPGFPAKNFVLFTDAKTRGGIEVLMHLSKQDMEKFEAHLELYLFKSNL